jgi:hypothetical protein
MKYKITAIPTVGVLENQPIVREGDDECLGYWSAATCMEGYSAPTRNVNGTYSREFYRRQAILLDLIAEAAIRATRILENWEKFKEACKRTRKDTQARHSYERVVMAKERKRGLDF